jgi:hypothetical protein
VLKQRLTLLDAETTPSQSNNRDTIHQLHAVAEFHCLGRLPDVLQMFRTSELTFDTSLTRDGVLFAAFLTAEGNGTEQDLALCINALRQYRWAYSKSEEREATLQAMWQNQRSESGHQAASGINSSTHAKPSHITTHQDTIHGSSKISHNNTQLITHPHKAHSRSHEKLEHSRSVSPVSPISVTMNTYTSDADDASGHHAERHHHQKQQLAEPRSSSVHDTTHSDSSSSYRTQTSHERSAPPRKQTLSPLERSVHTLTRSGPPSFQKLLN